MSETMTAREAAAALGVGRHAVLKAHSRGTLRGSAAGDRGAVLFDRADVEAYRAAHSRDADRGRVLEREAYRLATQGVELEPAMREAAERYAARRRQGKGVLR